MSSTPNKLTHNRNEFNDSFKHANETIEKNESCVNSEPDWDIDEHKDNKYVTEPINNEIKNDSSIKEPWLDTRNNLDKMNTGLSNREKVIDPIESHKRLNDWHNEIPEDFNQQRIMGNTTNFNRIRPYRERAGNYRQHPPPLMNVPVQAPRNTYHVNQRPLNKRNMTYTNPNIIKKQQAALAAAKAASQANAVAAATAVAAAKAAAQSAANATTNPGILGQVRPYQLHTEKPEAGEILSEVKNEIANKIELEKVSGELSEISDSDDEILTNMDKKAPKSETTPETTEPVTEAVNETSNVKAVEEIIQPNTTVNNEEEDILAFEEISDGEFEEDTRLKNVADALGVDWASLIAESKAQATEKIEISCEKTSAKQRWQSHRVLLQVGVSYRLAGEEFAKRLLEDSRNKLQLEVAQELDMKPTDEKSENIKPIDIKIETETLLGNSLEKPFAFSQVYERQNLKRRNQMFTNVCGPHSRALSARQDLRLRRQLCGLSADDCYISKPLPIISDKLKKLALNAFKCALEVK